ncbi:MAG: T9SS type A sorting domain-containing protein [candidate division Zixibacteria bacterium]|nr:T9SS type A sorting domain-containing protein [candidate division Zixibacteria bacterium]
MNNTVFALTEYDGKLIAGGLFTTSGGVEASCIACWDGSNWSPLGSGMTGGVYPYPYVRALAVYDGKLIAGGDFVSAGGMAASGIASWDGRSWSPLGSGMGGISPNVYALTVYDAKLIAGGFFTIAGDVEASRIASWNGSVWSPLRWGTNYEVLALTMYDGKLIAGGGFSTADSVTVNHIASWDGSSWLPLGSGMNNDVHALTVRDGKLIAGGGFTTAGGVEASRIDSWDGSSWSPLGSGMNGHVYAITVYDGKLAAGGSFTIAGNKVSAYLAQWTKGEPSDIDPDEQVNLPDAFSVVQNYPNPFNPATTIEYNVPSRTQVTIEIFNVIGQKVRTLVNETKSAGSYSTEWDGIDDSGNLVSTGVYLYRFSAGDVVQTKKMVLLK